MGVDSPKWVMRQPDKEFIETQKNGGGNSTPMATIRVDTIPAQHE
jgi:hypothetical protein